MTVLRSGWATDVGMVRSSNQDLALATSTLFAVADGMGGHAGGEVASRLAIEALQTAFNRRPTGAGLAEAVVSANGVVWQHSLENVELRGMGTTLTAVALVGDAGHDVLALVNVGDSRVYRFHERELSQVTHDHSLAEEMVGTGELTAAEAMVHPHRHILTRALGVTAEVDVDLWKIRPARGDRFLLCSDGLSNELGDSQIAEVLSSTADPQEAADLLVREARSHGGSDNITAVIVDVVLGEEDSGSTPAVAAVSPDFAAPAALAPVAEVRGLPSTGEGGAQSTADQGPAGTTAAPTPSRREQRREKRRQRRRARGRRLVTVRTFVFLVVFGAIVGGALYAIRWYDTNSYFVGLSSNGNEVTIYQGRIGGLFWYRPQVVQRTGLTVADLAQMDAADVRQKVQLSSLQSAQSYVEGLRSDRILSAPAATAPAATAPAATTPTSTTPTASTSPTATATSTTAPTTSTPPTTQAAKAAG